METFFKDHPTPRNGFHDPMVWEQIHHYINGCETCGMKHAGSLSIRSDGLIFHSLLQQCHRIGATPNEEGSRRWRCEIGGWYRLAVSTFCFFLAFGGWPPIRLRNLGLSKVPGMRLSLVARSDNNASRARLWWRDIHGNSISQRNPPGYPTTLPRASWCRWRRNVFYTLNKLAR